MWINTHFKQVKITRIKYWNTYILLNMHWVMKTMVGIYKEKSYVQNTQT